MWSDGVVEVLEFGEGGRGLGDGEFAFVAGPEFGSGGVVGALDAAVEPGGSWREDEERAPEVAAGGFELGHELGAAVDLDGPDPWVLVEQRFEELAGVAGGGAGEDEAEHEPGGRASGSECLECVSAAGDGHVVDLDEFAGGGGAHAGGESPGVAGGEVAAPLRRGPSAEEGAGPRVSGRHALREDPADVGSDRRTPSRAGMTRSLALPMKGCSPRLSRTARCWARVHSRPRGERGLRLFAASPPSRRRRFQRRRVALDQPTALRAVASEQPSERSRSCIPILRSRTDASGGADSSAWMARWERRRLECNCTVR